MPVIWFEEKTGSPATHPYRMDVGLFVGLAPLRSLDRLPDPLVLWYREQGWLERVRPASRGIHLRDVPVPVDSWETFRRFFVWPHAREAGSFREAFYPLARAVKAFFAQGGLKAYVVSMADPISPEAGEAERMAALERVLYGRTGPFRGVADRVRLAERLFPAVPRTGEDPLSQHGIQLGAALADTALVAFPDLPYLSAPPAEPVSVRMPERTAPESFVECVESQVPILYRRTAPPFRPLHDRVGYALWGRAIHSLLSWIAENAREWQLVCALPPPHPGCGPSWWADLCGTILGRGLEDGGCASAFLQCAFPWLGDAEDAENLLAPDGPLMGLLAANALGKGTFRSAAGSFPALVSSLDPVLSLSERENIPDAVHAMKRRLCLFESTPQGIQLASDRTTSLDPAHGPGCVSRLVGFLLKAARRLGESLVFENASPRLWRSVEQGFSSLLEAVYLAGGLGGTDVQSAFHVTCGIDTMTPQDVDSGRLIARIVVQPAVPVEAIQVVLAMEPSGSVTVTP
uniref:Phage tail sheath protein n=1 Tax=Desulfacinum infernum TaxID=35837 RepID=A0A832EKI8_9BACT